MSLAVNVLAPCFSFFFSVGLLKYVQWYMIKYIFSVVVSAGLKAARREEKTCSKSKKNIRHN